MDLHLAAAAHHHPGACQEQDWEGGLVCFCKDTVCQHCFIYKYIDTIWLGTIHYSRNFYGGHNISEVLH